MLPKASSTWGAQASTFQNAVTEQLKRLPNLALLLRCVMLLASKVIIWGFKLNKNNLKYFLFAISSPLLSLQAGNW